MAIGLTEEQWNSKSSGHQRHCIDSTKGWGWWVCVCVCWMIAAQKCRMRKIPRKRLFHLETSTQGEQESRLAQRRAYHSLGKNANGDRVRRQPGARQKWPCWIPSNPLLISPRIRSATPSLNAFTGFQVPRVYSPPDLHRYLSNADWREENTVILASEGAFWTRSKILTLYAHSDYAKYRQIHTYAKALPFYQPSFRYCLNNWSSPCSLRQGTELIHL